MYANALNGNTASNFPASGHGAASVLEGFYAKAPSYRWGVSRKVVAVFGSAALSWGVVFGVVAMLSRL
jgi:hypothetical protein